MSALKPLVVSWLAAKEEDGGGSQGSLKKDMDELN